MSLAGEWLFLLRLALAGVFCASAVGKAPQPRQFAAAVAAYRILPSALAAPFAWALISAETVVGLLVALAGLVIFALAREVEALHRRLDSLVRFMNLPERGRAQTEPENGREPAAGNEQAEALESRR